MGLERIEIEVVSAVNCVGQAWLVTPRTNRALVNVSGGDTGCSVALVGVPIQQTCIFKSADGVVTQVERTVKRVESPGDFHIVGISGPGNPGDSLLTARNRKFLLWGTVVAAGQGVDYGNIGVNHRDLVQKEGVLNAPLCLEREIVHIEQDVGGIDDARNSPSTNTQVGGSETVITVIVFRMKI